MSFGEETQNIGNINIEVLDYILSKSILTFLSTVSVDLSHKAAAETGIEADYGPQTPMNTTAVDTAVQLRWACHTRTVLRADAYGRQRCKVVLSSCSVVYLYCVSWAVCSIKSRQQEQTKF